MDTTQLLLNETQAKQMFRARVLFAQEDGTVLVSGDGVGEIVCDLLRTAEESPLRLAPGDCVLVWLAGRDEENGVILGRIGDGQAPAAAPPPETEAAAPEQAPDELVIEAASNLTLKCGDSSITLRGDGKVLIKGKDLVSRAKRTNRIKGGAVSIN